MTPFLPKAAINRKFAMLLGIGTDIIEVQRIKKSISNNAFFYRFFTESERTYISSKKNIHIEQTAAGIFCAKEACVKAIGTGFSGLRPSQIEIYREASGRPRIRIIGNKNFSALKFDLSISHTKEYATAFVVAYK